MWKDEENCPETCNTIEEFQCDKEDGNIKCIRIEKKCDGVQDCDNGKDESDCDFPQFGYCNSENKIPAHDMSNSEVEVDPETCNTIEEFQCDKEDGNIKCIPIEKKCDGVQDCESNGEDESDCGSENKIPAHGPNQDGCCMNSESGIGGCCPDFINVYDVEDKVKTIWFPSIIPVHCRIIEFLFFCNYFNQWQHSLAILTAVLYCNIM